MIYETLKCPEIEVCVCVCVCVGGGGGGGGERFKWCRENNFF